MDFLFGFIIRAYALLSMHTLPSTNDTIKRIEKDLDHSVRFLTFIRLICNREIIRYDIVFIISTAITAFGYIQKKAI